MKHEHEILPSAVEAIGRTPLIELSRFTADLKLRGRILGKCELLNPGLSKKDRIARRIVEDARADGRLKPGQTVVELTSGNTGAGLAIVCAVLGHPFVAVMSRGNSLERATMMRALGAEVALIDQAPGSPPGTVSGADLERVERAAQRLVEERGAFRADQFHNRAGFQAHFLTTGPEIIEQSAGRIDAFCDFVGTGGTFAGCAAAFKARAPAVRCYVVEPAGAQSVAGLPVTRPNHRIQGGGYSMADPPLIDRRHIDGFLSVDDDQAIDAARRLARTEGLLAGYSSGANLAAAAQLLRGPHAGQTVAVVLCDSGMKYLSTNLWE
jgi:cysteine synthase A